MAARGTALGAANKMDTAAGNAPLWDGDQIGVAHILSLSQRCAVTFGWRVRCRRRLASLWVNELDVAPQTTLLNPSSTAYLAVELSVQKTFAPLRVDE